MLLDTLRAAGRWLWKLPDRLRCSTIPKDAQQKGMSILGKDEHLSTEQPAMNGAVHAAEKVLTWTA